MSRRRERSTQASQSDEESLENTLLALSGSNTCDRVNNIVRYLVINAGKNVSIRRAELAKVAGGKTGLQFQEAVSDATRILKEVYGYNLLVVDAEKNNSKAYILSNCMPYRDYTIEDKVHIPEQEDDSDEETAPVAQKNIKNTLLLLILSHIFMSNAAVNETSLRAFLKPLLITHEQRHPVYGQIKDCIDGFVKTKYISAEVDPISKLVSYSWGIRAEKEISKVKVLQFACKMYGDKRPEYFVNQLRDAKAQCFENVQCGNRPEIFMMEVDE